MRILRLEAGSASSGALLLKRNGRGEYRIYPPKLAGRAVADLDVDLAEEITKAALAAMGGRSAHDVDHN